MLTFDGEVKETGADLDSGAGEKLLLRRNEEDGGAIEEVHRPPRKAIWRSAAFVSVTIIKVCVAFIL